MNSPRCARTLSKWLLERIDAFDHVVPSTADQTVMSDGISISFIDLIAVLFDFDRIVGFRSGCFWSETGAVARK